jgi:hypothetical protein
MNPDQLVIIHWRRLDNGYTGHGMPIPLRIAESHLAKLNLEYKNEIHHWIEPIP